MMTIRRALVVAVFALLAGSLALVTSALAIGGKPPVAPPGIPPERAAQADAERQEHERNFVTAFEVAGHDPRSLPRTHLEGMAKLPASLRESVGNASVIVVGVAERGRFASNPDGGLPIATTTIRIAEVLKRDATLAAGTQTLDLYQAGGPVPYPAPGGSLRELDIDELVLPGDQVVLFLTHQPRVSGFSALAGAGVYFVRAGRVTPEARNQFASTISGRSLPDVLAMIAAAAP